MRKATVVYNGLLKRYSNTCRCLYGLVLIVTGPVTLVQHDSRRESFLLPSSFFSAGPLALQFCMPSITSTAHVPQLPPPPQLQQNTQHAHKVKVSDASDNMLHRVS
jgi:hypothetical protein